MCKSINELVDLSITNNDLFKSSFSGIIKTGNDLIKFIEITRTKRGLGRSIKTAINTWIEENTNPYNAIKYRDQIADAIRLTRFKGDDPIYSYILKKYSNEIQNYNVKKYDEALKKYPLLQAYEDLMNSYKRRNYGVARMIFNSGEIPLDLISEHIVNEMRGTAV